MSKDSGSPSALVYSPIFGNVGRPRNPPPSPSPTLLDCFAARCGTMPPSNSDLRCVLQTRAQFVMISYVAVIQLYGVA